MRAPPVHSPSVCDNEWSGPTTVHQEHHRTPAQDPEPHSHWTYELSHSPEKLDRSSAGLEMEALRVSLVPDHQADASPQRLEEDPATPPWSPSVPSQGHALTERETHLELFSTSGLHDDERVSVSAMSRMRANDAGATGILHRFSRPVISSPSPARQDSPFTSNLQSQKLGTVGGVFLPCLQNILGIILFIRLSWIVGQAGIGVSLAIVAMCCSSTLLTGLSLSAIATNGVMKGGGPYFLIGRALGPEVGVSIGVCFYLATTTAASMYILGAVETLYNIAPQLMIYGSQDDVAFDIRDMQILGTAILAFLAFLVVLGVKHITKVAPFFLIPVLLSVLFIQIGIFSANSLDTPEGVTGLDPKTFDDNWEPGFTRTDAQGNPDQDGDAQWSFRALLALFYPSVTGIMAGSNRSASLRDPQASIPVGTLGAIAVTSTLYLVSVLLYGSVATRDYLLSERLMSAKVSWPAEEVVSVGITLSTLGAGLQSLVGAPRLVAAMANDRILPFLDVFAVKEGEEPRKALALTATITLAGVLVGNLDLITPIITMFFLLCYLGVNLSCLMLSLINAPSWRPRWQYYHWSLSLLGLILCVTIMFLISWLFSILALLMAFLMYVYVSEHGNVDNWGDGMKTLRLQFALKTLRGMDQHVHPKNWYPIPLVLCKPWGILPESMPCHPKLLSFSKYLHKMGDKGSAFVISIMTGDYHTRAEDAYFATKKLREHIEDVEGSGFVSGFSDVIVAPSVAEGFRNLIQTIGMGSLRPNLVIMRYPDIWRQAEARENIPGQFVSMVNDCYTAGKGLIMIKGLDGFPVESKGSSLRRRSLVESSAEPDVESNDGGLSAHPAPTATAPSRQTTGAGMAAREVETTSTFMRMFSIRNSRSAAQKTPEGTIDLYWITRDGGLMLLLGQLLTTRHSIWRKCSVRVFVVADNAQEQQALKHDVELFLYDLRMEANVIVLTAQNSDVCCECNQKRADVMHDFRRARKRVLLKNKLTMSLATSDAPTASRAPASSQNPTQNQLPVSSSTRSPAVLGALRGVPTNMIGHGSRSSMDSLDNPSETNAMTNALDAANSHQAGSSGASQSMSTYMHTHQGIQRSPTTPSQASCAHNSGAEFISEEAMRDSAGLGKDKGAELGLPPAHRSSTHMKACKDPSLELQPLPQMDVPSSTSTNPNAEAATEHSHVVKIDKYIYTSLKLNSTMRLHSKDAALVLVSLPPPPDGLDLPYNYMEYVDLLLKDIPRVLLVRGYRRNVVTLFS